MSAPPPPLRRITQATFDEAVAENEREFGMTRGEALIDAVTQFRASGVDLSNVITDGSADTHPVFVALRALRANLGVAAPIVEAASTDGTPAATIPGLDDALSGLTAACAASGIHRVIAGSNDGVTLVRAVIRRAHGHAPGVIENGPLLRRALEALRVLCFKCDENRASVPEHELDAVTDCMATSQPVDVQRAALLAAAVLCVKREPVKVYLFDKGVPSIICRNLSPPASGDAALVKDTATLLTKILTDDDFTVFSSKAYEYARVMAADGVASILLAALTAHNHTLSTAAEVLAALRSICVNDEICREIQGLDGISTITHALSEYVARGDGVGVGAASASAGDADDTTAGGTPAAGDGAVATPAEDAARRIRMVRNGFAVLRSLGHSDPVKLRMCEGDAAPLVLMLQSMETYRGSPSVLEQAISAVGILCLRLPSNAAIVHEHAALGLIAACMRAHPGSAGVQRASCLALRNIVTRSQPRIAAAFEEGFEMLLQAAYMRHMVARDVAYACLRDMGCAYAETDIGKAQAERAARAAQSGDIRTL